MRAKIRGVTNHESLATAHIEHDFQGLGIGAQHGDPVGQGLVEEDDFMGGRRGGRGRGGRGQ